MSKAGLGGLEVLLSSLFPAVGRSLTSPKRLDSGLEKVGFGYFIGIFFLLLALASFLLHHFHILRLSFPHKIS